MKDDELGKAKLEAAKYRISKQLADEYEDEKERKRKADEVKLDDEMGENEVQITDPEDQRNVEDDDDERPSKKAKTEQVTDEAMNPAKEEIQADEEVTKLSRLEQALADATRSEVSDGAAVADLMESTRAVSGGTAAAPRASGRVRVDVSEVFSPPRVTEMAVKFGLKAGDALGLTIGWDFNIEEHKEKAKELIRKRRPKLLMGSPDCTMFSTLQHMPNWSQEKQGKWERSVRHLRFVRQLYANNEIEEIGSYLSIQ